MREKNKKQRKNNQTNKNKEKIIKQTKTNKIFFIDMI